jgi:flagellar biosynthesis protein FlhB
VALTEACWLGARVIGLLVGVVALSSFAVGMAQTRCLFIPAQLFRGIEQYRPGAFLGRVKESSIDAFLGMLRCCLVLVLVAPLVFQVMQIVPSAFQGSEDAASDALYTVTRSVFLRSGYGLLVIAVIAYVLARWRFFKQLRMSLQELRDEYRDDEGDPHTKAARKHEHRNILFSEVEKRVKSSKVVIVRRVTEKK